MYNLIQIGIFLFFFTIFKKKKLFGASYIKKKVSMSLIIHYIKKV